MVREDVERLFGLLKLYFPNSRKTGDRKLQSAWFRLLEPYSPEVVQKAVTETLRRNENFPDPQKIAVLCETAEPAPEELSPAPGQRRRSDNAWMVPYIRKNAAKITDEDAEDIHAAGLMTWREAETTGVDFAEWNRAYRAKFPVGFPEKRIEKIRRNSNVDEPDDPPIALEKKREIPPKPEGKPVPAPREKLAAAIRPRTGRSREEVLAMLKGGETC